MEQYITEAKRMQELAGIVSEDVETDEYDVNDQSPQYYLNGYNDYHKGIKLDFSPYRDESFENDWWRKGWKQAELDELDSK